MLFQDTTRIALPNLVAYYLARGSKTGMLCISRIFQGQIVWQTNAHQGEITSLAWSHDGELLASSGADGMIRIWRAATGDLLCSFVHQEEVERLQWSANGTLAASSGGVIHLFPIALRRLLAA